LSKIIICLHCGNETQMNLVSNYKDKEEDFDEGIWEEYKWKLYQCPVCKNVTLEKESLYSEDIFNIGHLDAYEQSIEVEKATRVDTLYPFQSNDSNYIPKNVKSAFEAAIKVRNIDGAICVLSLRRALEKMCKDKGAVGDNLVNKLYDLRNKKVLPPTIKDVAFVLKNEGNSAAHADDVDFDKRKVDFLIGFTRTILDYVYTLPMQIKEVQSLMKKV